VHGTSGTKAVYIETGLDTTEIPKTSDGRSTAFTTAANLIDSSFTVSVDNRFVTAIHGLTSAGGTYSNGTSDNAAPTAPMVSDGSLVGAGTTSQIRMNYTDHIVYSSQNQVYTPDTGAASDYTNLTGPGASVAFWRPTVDTSLTTLKGGTSSTKFKDFGQQSQDLFSDGNRYDYVDTMVYVTGQSSGVTLSIPIRIIRQAS
jgi:hypothetical protein